MIQIPENDEMKHFSFQLSVYQLIIKRCTYVACNIFETFIFNRLNMC